MAQSDLTKRRADLVAGILLAETSLSSRAEVVANARRELTRRLDRSCLWTPDSTGQDPRDGQVERGFRLHRSVVGSELPYYRSPGPLAADEVRTLAKAWVGMLGRARRLGARYLRVRVDNVDDVRRLRDLGSVDGLTVVPSLLSSGAGQGFAWHWPVRVGVLPGPESGAWLDAIRDTSGQLCVAELFHPRSDYDLLLVDGAALGPMPLDRGSEATRACVVVAGEAPIDRLLEGVEKRLGPTVAVAFQGGPALWWHPLVEELARDEPLDVAVEVARRNTGVDALLAGPHLGLDLTPRVRWLASFGLADDGLDWLVRSFMFDWTSGNGRSTMHPERMPGMERWQEIEQLFDQKVDPSRAANGPLDEDWPIELLERVGTTGGAFLPDVEPEPDAAELGAEGEFYLEPAKPPEPRRLLVRVKDGDRIVESVLPPGRELSLRVRIGIPETGDTSADALTPIPADAGPVVPLVVVVRGSVWAEQPPPLPIVVSRDKLDQPSTWAVFPPFLTPAEGQLVTIDVTLLYQGKPLQAATYVSPVRANPAEPDDRPTLTTYALSSPAEPTEDMRPVGVTLDASGAEIRPEHGDGRVPLDDVQGMLDQIDDVVSQVLGREDAPASLDDRAAVLLMVNLARLGIQLRGMLRPLAIPDRGSIDIRVNDNTRVLPLELAYDGPPPQARGAKLCDHVATPPDPGQGCTPTSPTVVCPYAFWGLSRVITRTVQWPGPAPVRPDAAQVTPFSVLYAASRIADSGSRAPRPSAQVKTAARSLCSSVTRVQTWKEWRLQISLSRPRLLVVLGHTVIRGIETKLFIGRSSALARADIAPEDLLALPSPKPLVLLMACSTATLGDAFGTLPGAFTAAGAGAVVGTLGHIIGPHGATAATHLLKAYQTAAASNGHVGDMVMVARRSLLAEKHPIGLLLVSHGELDTKATL